MVVSEVKNRIFRPTDGSAVLGSYRWFSQEQKRSIGQRQSPHFELTVSMVATPFQAMNAWELSLATEPNKSWKFKIRLMIFSILSLTSMSISPILIFRRACLITSNLEEMSVENSSGYCRGTAGGNALYLISAG